MLAEPATGDLRPGRGGRSTNSCGYAIAAGVEWVSLTDGHEYRLHDSHATVPVGRKLFRTIRVSDPDTRPAETILLLSKNQLQDHLTDQY
jgi:hypothetical protein